MAEQRPTRHPLGGVPPKESTRSPSPTLIRQSQSSGHGVPMTSSISNVPTVHVPTMYPFIQQPFGITHAMGAAFHGYSPPPGVSQSYLSQRIQNAGLVPNIDLTTPTKTGRGHGDNNTLGPTLGSPFQTPTAHRDEAGRFRGAGNGERGGKRLPSRFPRERLESPSEDFIARTIEKGRGHQNQRASASLTVGTGATTETPTQQKRRRSSTEEPSQRPVRSTRTVVNYRRVAGISESPAPEDDSAPGPHRDDSLPPVNNRRFTRSGSSNRSASEVDTSYQLLPEGLQPVRTAMGANAFDQFYAWVKLHVEEYITEEEMNIQLGRLCQINDAGAKRRILKMIKELINDRKEAELKVWNARRWWLTLCDSQAGDYQETAEFVTFILLYRTL